MKALITRALPLMFLVSVAACATDPDPVVDADTVGVADTVGITDSFDYDPYDYGYYDSYDAGYLDDSLYEDDWFYDYYDSDAGFDGYDAWDGGVV